MFAHRTVSVDPQAEYTVVDVSTSLRCAVSLGFDYRAWCRVTVRRLSCTATLILSINNKPPHCCPEPHLLITICHLSDCSTSPSPFLLPSLLLCFSSHPPSLQGQLSPAPPPHFHPQLPLSLTPGSSARFQLRDMVQHTEGWSRSPLLLAHFNCTLEAAWLIKNTPAVIAQITANNLDCGLV